MSYDLHLIDPKTKEVLELTQKHNMKGGTYRVGGEPQAKINITYNYAPFFVVHLGPEGIRTLYGKTGKQTAPILAQAIANMNDDRTERYWDPTEGNAREALKNCLVLANLCPDGIWEGD
jgi:hypothetical protein